jgi:5-hydroxyisourate hydrolase-like protein (transthyretin family)
MQVFYDLNNDGIQDADETGVAGVTVTLKDAGADGIVGTADDGADRLTTTNSQGEYIFTNLPAGNYAVEFTDLPAGYDASPSFTTDDTKDSDGSPISGGKSTTPVVALAAGEENLTIDLGINDATPLNTIGNYVWLDANKDGKQGADELAVPGVMVTLLNVDATTYDSDLGTLGVQPKITSTDANGKYLFTDLPDGSYSVKFSNLPTGYGFTTKDATNTVDGSDANPLSGISNIIAVAGGQTDLTLDAGISSTTKAALGNYVWVDANKDGIQDATEEPVAGVLVTLYDATNNPIATTVTDANGKYLFPNLEPGTYTAGFTNLPAGVEFTTQDADPITGSDVNPATGKTAPITLAAGEVNLNVDAGVAPKATGGLGNYVWYDDNKDGIQNATEKGVPGVTVTLKDVVTGDVIGTAITDGNGYYLFPNLDTSKTYTATFSTLPKDYGFTVSNGAISDATNSDANPSNGITTTASVTAGEVNPNVDAGIFKAPASIGNTVFLDADKDGVQDATETGVAGVTVTLYDAAGNPVASTITDGSGKYKFTNLVPSSYTVGFTPPVDYTFTTPSSLADDSTDKNSDASATPGATFGRSGLITLASGEYDSTVDAGLVSSITQNVGNKVWFDTNKDGIQDAGEEGVAGVTVTLKDAAGNVVATTVTNSVGDYLFKDVPAGTGYTMEFTPPVGTVFTTQEATSATDNTGSNPNSLGVTPAFDVLPGEDNLTIDAGIYLQPADSASVGNKVFEDLNQDGIQDAGEPGIAGVPVTLKDGNGNVVATTTTNEFGEYIFNDLTPGVYTIDFGTPAGYTASPYTDGINDPKNSDNNAGSTKPFTLAPGEKNLNVDAGFFETAPAGTLKLGNKVWYDADKDGIQDATEAPVAGVTVELLDAAGAVIETTTTDANGNYLFTNLAAGNYQVKFSNLPVGYVFTTPDATGTAGSPNLADGGANDSDAPSSGLTPVINLTADNLDVDAGIVPGVDNSTLGSIGDKVFYDNYNDGIQDANEVGVAGITVTLKDADGNVVATTKTDALGNYLFTGLPEGEYTVEFSNLPPAYVASPTSGTDPNTNSDGTETAPGSGIFASPVISLGKGEDRMDIDLGVSKPGSNAIGDKVFMDNNNDGIQDPTEAGAAGVTVTLFDATGAPIATTTTDKDGKYMFNGLPDGSYSVGFSNTPDGYTFSPSNTPGDNANNTNSDANPATGKTGLFALSGGEIDSTVDAGIYNPNVGSVGGLIWNDLNADGIQDANEKPTPGLIVTLKDGNGNPVGTAITDGNGEYLFTGLPLGDYTVDFTKPDGTAYSIGTPAGTTNNDYVAGGTPVSITAANKDPRNVDAGYNKPLLASVGDYVWFDANENGLQDAGELPVPGVKVTLFDATGTEVATAITDENGRYQINDITPGSGYSIEFSNFPAGSTLTGKDVDGAGLAGSNNSDSDPATGKTGLFALVPGEHQPGVDAGLIPQAYLGSLVWNDLDNDGVFDANELPIPGAKVYVYDVNGAVVDSAITDAMGMWKIPVDAGTYTIGVDSTTLGQLHISDVVPVGSDGHNDATRNSGRTGGITVAPGQYVSNVWIGATGLAPFDVVNVTLSGTAQAAANYLTWTAIGDDKVATYELQKSINGVYKTVYTIASKQAASAEYAYVDNTTSTKVNYKVISRLLDGTSQESNVVTLSKRGNTAQVIVTPNPTTDVLTVKFNTTVDTEVTIQVIDATGKLVRLVKATAVTGDNNVVVDLTQLANGNYNVRVVTGIIVNTVLVQKQ